MKRKTQEFSNTVIQMYQIEMLSTPEIAKRIGCAKATCARILKREGIALRHRHELRTHYTGAPRKYSLDESYFDAVDTEEKAYWLGFLSADGSVTKQKVISLALAIVDRSHVEKFAVAVGSTSPVKITAPKISFIGSQKIATGEIAALRLNSSKMTRALRELGLHSNKTYDLQPWQGREDLMRHYWRGMVDGDGWVRKMKNGNWAIGLVGTLPIVQGFISFAKTVCGARVTPYQSGNVWTVQFAGMEHVGHLVNALYGQSCVALERKKVVAFDLLSMPIKKRFRRELSNKELADDYLAGISVMMLAKKHGLSHPTICQRLEKAGVQRRGRLECQQVRRQREQELRNAIQGNR